MQANVEKNMILREKMPGDQVGGILMSLSQFDETSCVDEAAIISSKQGPFPNLVPIPGVPNSANNTYNPGVIYVLQGILGKG